MGHRQKLKNVEVYIEYLFKAKFHLWIIIVQVKAIYIFVSKAPGFMSDKSFNFYFYFIKYNKLQKSFWPHTFPKHLWLDTISLPQKYHIIGIKGEKYS